MVYPRKWSPVSCRPSAGQRKHAGRRPMSYHWTTQPTTGPRKSVLLKCVKNYEIRRSSSKDVLNQMQWPRLIMTALWNRGRLLYFHPVVSFYLISFFLSSPNLSGRTLDVLPIFHTRCGLRCKKALYKYSSFPSFPFLLVRI